MLPARHRGTNRWSGTQSADYRHSTSPAVSRLHLVSEVRKRRNMIGCAANGIWPYIRLSPRRLPALFHRYGRTFLDGVFSGIGRVSTAGCRCLEHDVVQAMPTRRARNRFRRHGMLPMPSLRRGVCLDVQWWSGGDLGDRFCRAAGGRDREGRDPNRLPRVRCHDGPPSLSVDVRQLGDRWQLAGGGQDSGS